MLDLEAVETELAVTVVKAMVEAAATFLAVAVALTVSVGLVVVQRPVTISLFAHSFTRVHRNGPKKCVCL